VKTDVSKPDNVDRLVSQALARFGRIDILVNNAGVEEDVPASDLTLDRFDETMAVNLRGAFHLCREAGRDMLQRGSGKIINIASVLGFVAYPGALAYSASKAALIQMTRTLAVEWGPKGVNVNCIAPGFFNTELVREYLDDPEQMSFILARNPSGRTAEPEEILGTVQYLASAASDYVHGALLVVDGGESVAGGYTKAILDDIGQDTR
jgi:NAD(P)-dependent dehydrogenase (short-subunit alcohol dehydrogenase family)